MMDYEPEFSELLLQAPELFLSTKYNLSEGDYSWWLGLQPQRKRSYSSYKQLLEKAFTMFPTGPEISRPSPDRCLTCALVGNSGNLNGSYYGPLIDFHDIVIRINSAQVKGYEKDVGTKTTHHVMYPVSATNISSSTHLILFAFKTSDLAWLINALTPKVEKGNKTSLEANKDLVMILNPAFIKYVHHVWLKKVGMYPSTGFLTLILSLHICDELDVFGFGVDKNGDWSHYFEKLTRKRLRTGNHPGEKEYKIIERLHRQRKIRFFRGW